MNFDVWGDWEVRVAGTRGMGVGVNVDANAANANVNTDWKPIQRINSIKTTTHTQQSLEPC